jgi:hypothetical protein
MGMPADQRDGSWRRHRPDPASLTWGNEAIVSGNLPNTTTVSISSAKPESHCAPSQQDDGLPVLFLFIVMEVGYWVARGGSVLGISFSSAANVFLSFGGKTSALPASVRFSLEC